MFYELEYLDDPRPEDEQYYSVSHGERTLFEKATVRIFVDGRRVVTPYGFTAEIEAPDSASGSFSVRPNAITEDRLSSFIYALDDERERGQEVVIEHEVDGEVSRYRLAKGYDDEDAIPVMECELVEGTPTIFHENRPDAS